MKKVNIVLLKFNNININTLETCKSCTVLCLKSVPTKKAQFWFKCATVLQGKAPIHRAREQSASSLHYFEKRMQKRLFRTRFLG